MPQMSASELYEAAMSLPPAERKALALWLLESDEEPDAEFSEAAEHWLQTEAVAAYDALKADPSRAIPAEQVRAEFEARWAARSRPAGSATPPKPSGSSGTG